MCLITETNLNMQHGGLMDGDDLVTKQGIELSLSFLRHIELLSS